MMSDAVAASSTGLTSRNVRSSGNWSRRLRYYVGGEISGRVGDILGRFGEIFWTRRRNILHSSAAFCSPRRHKIGRLGKETVSATIFVDASANAFVASVGSLLGEMCFNDIFYITDSCISFVCCLYN